MIHFTFDDGNTSDPWAAQVLKSHGLQGAFFVNEKPGIEYDIEALLEAGMIVGNHTQFHTRIEGLSDEAILEAVGKWNDRLKQLGASGDYFSFPFSSGPRKNPILTSMFKYIYRGYEDERDNMDGEISRVTVTNKSLETVLSYTKPLQLHGIQTGQTFDIARESFIFLCKKRSQS